MRGYSLLECWPAPSVGYGASGNKGVGDFDAETKEEAVTHFQALRPDLPLDDTGYCKVGTTTFVVAEGAKKYIWRD